MYHYWLRSSIYAGPLPLATPIVAGTATQAVGHVATSAAMRDEDESSAETGLGMESEFPSVVSLQMPGDDISGAAGRGNRGGGGLKSKKGKGRGAGRGQRGGRPLGSAGVGVAPRREVLGPDTKPLPFDPVRDAVGAALSGSMELDFIVVKLRASCQLCKRFITGGVGMRYKYRCKLCSLNVG